MALGRSKKRMDTLQFLTHIAILLLIGIACSMLAKRLRIPQILLLVFAGIGLSRLTREGQPYFQFDPGFLMSISVLTLVMLVFDGSSRFKLRTLDSLAMYSLRVVILFAVFNILFLAAAASFIFDVTNLFLCLIFAAVMSGTDAGSVMSLFKGSSSKVIEMLKVESVLNTPLMVLIPFILLDLMELGTGSFNSILEQAQPFLQQIITGVGTGVVVGLIIFRAMRRYHHDSLSPIILVASTLLTYILAENLGGNGVLAISELGVFFGNFYVKGKEAMQEFSQTLAGSLEILVFMLIGFIIPIDITLDFFLKSLLLFMIMLILRSAAIWIAFYNDHLNAKEKVFMSLNCAEGIGVAVVAFMLSRETISKYVVTGSGDLMLQSTMLSTLPGADDILMLMVLFMIYSIIISAVASRFSGFFLGKEE